MVVSICISLIISDVDHFFVCFLAIWMYSLEKCLFGTFNHFWLDYLLFFILSCSSCFYNLETNPLFWSLCLQMFPPILWFLLLSLFGWWFPFKKQKNRATLWFSNLTPGTQRLPYWTYLTNRNWVTDKKTNYGYQVGKGS